MNRNIIYICQYCDYKWHQQKTQWGWIPHDQGNECPKCQSRDVRTHEYDEIEYYEKNNKSEG